MKKLSSCCITCWKLKNEIFIKVNDSAKSATTENTAEPIPRNKKKICSIFVYQSHSNELRLIYFLLLKVLQNLSEPLLSSTWFLSLHSTGFKLSKTSSAIKAFFRIVSYWFSSLLTSIIFLLSFWLSSTTFFCVTFPNSRALSVSLEFNVSLAVLMAWFEHYCNWISYAIFKIVTWLNTASKRLFKLLSTSFLIERR